MDPTTAFRIGTDGMSAPLPRSRQTLAQPFFPGVGGNAGASDVTVLDPKYRPERTDNFTSLIQRQISQKTTLEVGYIGRIIRNECQEINLDAVPYMTTLGGQTFAQAFAATYFAVATQAASQRAQPFFESALGGAGSAYCTGFANCTAAVGSKNARRSRIRRCPICGRLYRKVPPWTLGRSMISALPGQAISQGNTYIATTSLGYGNYNALFLTYRMRDFHGMTGDQQLHLGPRAGYGTTSQATSSNTALDVFNMHANYGPQNFDIKFIYNVGHVLQPKIFAGQKGVLRPRAGRMDLLAAVHRAERRGTLADVQRRRLHRLPGVR